MITSKSPDAPPERITARICGRCSALVIGQNNCPYCGNPAQHEQGAEYVHASSAPTRQGDVWGEAIRIVKKHRTSTRAPMGFGRTVLASQFQTEIVALFEAARDAALPFPAPDKGEAIKRAAEKVVDEIDFNGPSPFSLRSQKVDHFASIIEAELGGRQ